MASKSVYFSLTIMESNSTTAKTMKSNGFNSIDFKTTIELSNSITKKKKIYGFKKKRRRILRRRRELRKYFLKQILNFLKSDI